MSDASAEDVRLARVADKPLVIWCQEVVSKRMDNSVRIAPLFNVWLRGRDRLWREALAVSVRVASCVRFHSEPLARLCIVRARCRTNT